MKTIGTLLIALGLVLGACGGGGEGPPMPDPEPGKLPGQTTTGEDDLDSLADMEDEQSEEAPAPAEEAAEDEASPAEEEADEDEAAEEPTE